MVGVPECIVCNYPYDLASHEPMSLSCGHSVCRSCWEEWVERKGAVCPNDRQPVTSAVNYGLREMLQAGTPCDIHPHQVLEYVCPDDEMACCARCIIQDHHGHHRPLTLDFNTLHPMFEAALAETSRRLTAVEAIETDAQRVCHDAGELVRTVVARRDELLRVVLPGYTGGLPWSFMQQPIQPLDTSEVRMLYDRLSNLVQSRTDPATAFKVYRELKDTLNRCLPHIPPMPQGGYDRSGLDNLYGALHMWGNQQSQQQPQHRMMAPPGAPPHSQFAPPTMPPSAPPTGLAIAPPPTSSFLNISPKLEGLGSAGSATQSPSLFSANGFGVGPPSPGPRASVSMPSPLQIDSTSSTDLQPQQQQYQPPQQPLPGLNGWAPSGASESSISSPTDSPHRIITAALSDLSLTAAATSAATASPARSNETSVPTASSVVRGVQPAPPVPRPPVRVQPPQPQAAAAEDSEPMGEELRGVVACLLNDTHDEGFCEVRGPRNQYWNVYYNLHGGKVATVNVSGFDPAILEAGYEVFVRLADNPDQARAAQDPARKYVARSMRLGEPPKRVRGVVHGVWNEGQDGFCHVESPDGHTTWKVYFRFGLGGTFKTGHDPKNLNPAKLKTGTVVAVTLMDNPQKDKGRDPTRKYVARSIKMP